MFDTDPLVDLVADMLAEAVSDLELDICSVAVTNCSWKVLEVA